MVGYNLKLYQDNQDHFAKLRLKPTNEIKLKMVYST